MSPDKRRRILKRWGLTEQELTDIVDQNPSMRGLMLGYVAEYKLRNMHFSDPVFENVHKGDDHDRTRKCDLTITYKGREFRCQGSRKTGQ